MIVLRDVFLATRAGMLGNVTFQMGFPQFPGLRVVVISLLAGPGTLDSQRFPKVFGKTIQRRYFPCRTVGNARKRIVFRMSFK